MNKNKKTKTWIVVTLIFILVFSFYFLVYRNIVFHLKDLDNKVTSLKTQIEAKKRIALKLNQYKAELIQLKEAFSRFSNYLSKPGEISDSLVEISDTLTQYNIKPLVFQPGEEKFEDKSMYGVFPINLKIACDYFTLIKFLDKIESSDKIVYVDQIDIVSTKDSKPQADIRFSLLLQKEGVKF